MDFSPKQYKAIKLLALGELTDIAICEELNINRSTLYSWKKKPGFMDLVVQESRKLLKEQLPKVYHSLSREAADGDIQHIKTLLEHLEKLEEQKQAQTSLSFTWKSNKNGE